LQTKALQLTFRLYRY